jgi:hypothetical protein
MVDARIDVIIYVRHAYQANQANALHALMAQFYKIINVGLMSRVIITIHVLVVEIFLIYI